MCTEVAGDGSRRIVVEVPGVSDKDQIRSLVGSTGQLQFIDPRGQQLTRDQDIRALLEAGAVGVLFDGGQIDPNSVAPDVSDGSLGVSFTLRDEGRQIWCQFTTANVNRQGPIALDGRVITVPNIQGAICGGQTIITVGAGGHRDRGGAHRPLQHPPLRRAAGLAQRAGCRRGGADARSPTS